MKLIHPFASIVDISVNPLELIEMAGRTCYKSESKITPTSSEAFVKKIIERGHEAVLEHPVATVRFIIDRGISHEIVRHRLASYCQESTRYCDYEGGHVTFIIPSWVNIAPGVYTDLHSFNGMYRLWAESLWMAESAYKDLRQLDWSPQQARSVLPNSLKTEIVMTTNFREWRHFFKLRTSSAAHPQMREVTIPLLKTFRELVPVVFDIEVANG
jgi:thymidylate synthase (FAD)